MTIKYRGREQVSNINYGRTDVGPAVSSSQYSATSTSGEALAANEQRAWATFANTGNRVVYLAIGDAAVAGQGIVVQPDEVFRFDGPMMTGQAINAITQAGSTTIAIEEVDIP